MKKKLILGLAFIVIYLGLSAEFAAGSGTEEDPWQIETAEHLNNIRNYLGHSHGDKYFLQIADIDLGTAPWNEGAGWEPIGYWSGSDGISHAIDFQGRYDGNGHIIDNLYINRPDNYEYNQPQGLFGLLSMGTILNLGVINVNIIGFSNVASLAGQNFGSSILNCYSSGYVAGDSKVGGLIGLDIGSTIMSSHSSVNVNGEYLVGGLIGKSQGSFIENSYYNYDTVLINGEKHISIGALYNSQYNDWLDNNLSLNINDYLTSDGQYYLINNAADLKQLLAFGQFSEYSFSLSDNIDLSSEPNFYIPYFAGTFDGKNKQISNLNLSVNFCNSLALFSYTKEASILNLGVTDAYVFGKSNVGIIAGYNDSSTIQYCYSIGNIVGTSTVGGLVGENYNSTISHCYSSGSVVCEFGTGGLVGRNYHSNIDNSYSVSSINGSSFAGGLAGSNVYANISNSYSAGSVSGNSNFVGGFIGYDLDSFTENSYWNIETSGQTTSAGGEGRTTAEMTFPCAGNTYTGWDFTEIWVADEDYSVNNGYPFLHQNLVSTQEDLFVSPEKFIIGNFPNPFNPSTTIQFSGESFAQNEQITVEIFNIKGQRIRQFNIHNSKLKINEVVWVGKDNENRPVSSGIYLYQIKSDTGILGSKKMLLMK